MSVYDPLQKTEMIRSGAIRKSARGQVCLINLPGCSYDPSQSQWVHSDMQMHGKAGSVKAHDIFGAIGCSHCHGLIHASPGRYDDEMHRAIAKSMLFLVGKGIVVVKK